MNAAEVTKNKLSLRHVQQTQDPEINQMWSDFVQTHQELESELITDQQYKFKEEIVDEQTHFNYEHLENGCALAGYDFQSLMRQKLQGKDLQRSVKVSGTENSEPLLNVALTQAEQIVVASHKKQFQDSVLCQIDKNLDDDVIYNQAYNYIKYYGHVLPLDTLVYSWPMFDEGFKLVDRDFKAFMQEQMGDKPLSEFMFIEKGDDVVINPEFKSVLAAAQMIMMDGIKNNDFQEILKNAIHSHQDLKNSPDQKFQFLVKYKDIAFIKKTLQMWDDEEGINLGFKSLARAIVEKDFDQFKILIDLFSIDLHKNHTYLDDEELVSSNLITMAIAQGDKILKYLIERKVDVNSKSTAQNITFIPLQLAVFCNDYHSVQLLLDAGADITFVNEKGKAADYAENDRMRNIFKQATQKRVLQEIEHISTFAEQEQFARLQKEFELLGLNYQKFMEQQIAGQHLDLSTFDEQGIEGKTVVEGALDAAEQKIAQKYKATHKAKLNLQPQDFEPYFLKNIKKEIAEKYAANKLYLDAQGVTFDVQAINSLKLAQAKLRKIHEKLLKRDSHDLFWDIYANKRAYRWQATCDVNEFKMNTQIKDKMEEKYRPFCSSWLIHHMNDAEMKEAYESLHQLLQQETLAMHRARYAALGTAAAAIGTTTAVAGLILRGYYRK